MKINPELLNLLERPWKAEKKRSDDIAYIDAFIRLSTDRLLTAKQVRDLGGKGVVFELMRPGVTYDSALPQMWLNQFKDDNYTTVLFGAVTAYYANSGIFGQIEAVSVEAQELISKNSTGKN